MPQNRQNDDLTPEQLALLQQLEADTTDGDEFVFLHKGIRKPSKETLALLDELEERGLVNKYEVYIYAINGCGERAIGRDED